MAVDTGATAFRGPESMQYGHRMPRRPVIQPAQRTVVLDLFDVGLVNGPEGSKRYGNTCTGWDELPKFFAEHLNNKDGQVPNSHSVDFQLNGQRTKITLFPGTFYPSKTSKPLRRYPGVKEQLVEQALIDHAAHQVEGTAINNMASRDVTFSINALARRLKAMGSTMSNTQIRQALEVLSSTVMTLSYGDDLKMDNRDTLLSSFGRNNPANPLGNNGNDTWCVRLHTLAAQWIANVLSCHYFLGQLKGYSPVGAALLRRIHYIAVPGSEEQPYRFTVQKMKMTTAGLNHVRLSGSMQLIRKELERMQADHYLARFIVEEIFPAVRGRGRPVPIDYRFTLYPGPRWIKSKMLRSN